jgi:uncharacterized membrane protein YwzB
MNLKYTILIYLVLLIFIFFWKPEIFKLDNENKKRKMLYLVFLIIIIAIISFYTKILSEWFL